MVTIETLLELLATYGGSIVSTVSLTTNEIDQARESGRMFVDNQSLGYVWEPEIKRFPETEDEVKWLERWYPLEVKLPERLSKLDLHRN